MSVPLVLVCEKTSADKPLGNFTPCGRTDVPNLSSASSLRFSVAPFPVSFCRDRQCLRLALTSHCSYSLVVLDNQNLQLLWDWSSRPKNSSLTLLKGKVFFHINPKLCLTRIKELHEHAKVANWSEQDVSPLTNGDRAACE